MTDTPYQISRNGPLTKDAVEFLRSARAKNGWSYAALGKRLGISQAFTHHILNKGSNISTDTYMTKVAAGIEALKGNAEAPPPAWQTKTRLLEHFYHLRDDLQVSIKLPADLTDREAERLGRFVTSLAR